MPVPAPLASNESDQPDISTYLPEVSEDNRFFWEGTKDCKLLLQRCKACGTMRHPFSPCCSKCRSLQWETYAAGIAATLYSVARVLHPPTPPHGTGYLICVAELNDCGLRIVSNLRDCDLADARIGMALALFFEPIGSGYKLPQFRPAIRGQEPSNI